MASTSASGASRIVASEVTHTEERRRGKQRQAAAPYQKGRAAKSKSTIHIYIEQDNLHNKHVNDAATATQPVVHISDRPYPPLSADICHIPGGHLVPVREGCQTPEHSNDFIYFEVNRRVGVHLSDVWKGKTRAMDYADSWDFSRWGLAQCHLFIQVCHQWSLWHKYFALD